jgi:serine/threonine-protein kinase
LGLKTVRGFIVITGTRAAVQARQSRLINQQCFWNSSIQKALFARLVARILKTDEETAFAGALLQDFLLPVITNELFDQYVSFLQRREEHPVMMADYEQQSFGWNHAFAGACLARRWKLPDELVACILFHHHGLHLLADPRLARTPVAAVAISALIPDQLRQCYVGLEQLELLQQKWPAFQFGSMVEQVDELHAGLGMGVANDFPLVRRCKPARERDRSARFNDGSLTVAAACQVALAPSA